MDSYGVVMHNQVILHCYFCTLFALILLWLRPGLFPALRDPDKKVELSLRFLATELGCWKFGRSNTCRCKTGVEGMRNEIFILTSWPWKYGGTAAQKVE